MRERLIQAKVNELVDRFLEKGTLAELSIMLGVNLSTLWRYRRKGFTDPYSVYVIAKASGETEEVAQSLAKDVFIANGGNPDAPVRKRLGPADRMREQIRELVQEELSKATKAG